MSVSVQIGLAFALATSIMSLVGFLYKQRGAAESPPVTARHPVSSTLTLLRSRWYLLGISIALASWGLHATALALAPISLVQTVIAGGLVFLTLVADRLFGIAVGRREWICVTLAAVGLAFLAATIGPTGSNPENHYVPATLVTYIAVLSVAAALLGVAAGRRGIPAGTALGVSAGLLWGASDISIKALSGALHQAGVGVLIHPLAGVIVVASLVGLSVSARSLQIGNTVTVIAATSAAANLTTIAAGAIVFGEPLPSGPLGVATRVTAFVLVIVAVVLTPPPIAALSPTPGEAA